MKKTILVSFILMICMIFVNLSGCSGSESSPTPDTTSPTVSSTTPATGATGVATNAAITVTFSEAMDPATINSTTFALKDSGDHATSGTVSSSGTSATFTPSSVLDHLTTYTATITTGAKNLAGTRLAADHTWSFTVDTTPSPLLSAQTLKAWVDNGLVNGPASNRVVVLDVANGAYSTTGHVPGAHLVSSVYQNRLEGPAVDVNMVLDVDHIDSIVQGNGIDNRTTIVFTSGGSSAILNATRAYWMFRYWGFPKEKLKVLDGVNTSWTPYVLTTVAPPTMSSTYSVRNNGRVETDLRASLSEMIEVVSSIAAGTLTGTVILDARAAATAGSYAGVPHSTAGVFDADLATTDYVVFEGHMKGAQALDYKKTYDAATLRFMSPEFLTTTLLTVGINQSTETTYVHCRTGVIAAVPFFVLDAILGWPVVLYDGSWSQWGQMSANTANGGQLAAGSRWITDTLSEAPGGGQVTYNHSSSPTAYPVELLARDGSTCSATLLPDDSIIYKAGCTDITPPESDATPGNQIEDKDKAYLPE